MAVAIVAYGSFAIAFAAAALVPGPAVHRLGLANRPEPGGWGLPRLDVLDDIGYRAVVVGFPFLTLTIILGAIWANTAWGTYWSWDPKETASLVTWFIYGSYLHARVMRGWRGKRAAMLLVLGLRRHAVHVLREPVLRRAPQLRRPELIGPGRRGLRG